MKILVPSILIKLLAFATLWTNFAHAYPTNILIGDPNHQNHINYEDEDCHIEVYSSEVIVEKVSDDDYYSILCHSILFLAQI